MGWNVAPLDRIDVVILAGGRGTRLASAVPDRPKVLAKVAGRPFLDHQLDLLQDAGARRVVLALGYRAEDVLAYIEARPANDMELVPSIEDIALDTGGGLRLALSYLTTDPVLVMNGDSFAAIDFAAMAAAHRNRNGTVTLALGRVENAGRYGRVRVDDAGQVVAFEEKSAEAGGGDINLGIYLMARTAIEGIDHGRPVSLERETFPGLVGKGLYGFASDAPFIDIGTPESLAAADDFFRRRRASEVA